MKSIQKVGLILAVLVSLGCGLLSRAAAPAATAPTASAAISPEAPAAPASTAASAMPIAAGPTQDACARDALRAYLRAFAIPMAEYEFSLVQVFGLTIRMGGATKDELTAAVTQAQSARDSIAGMQAPYCAQKMQADMLSSMDHTIAAIKLNIDGKSTEAQVELAKAKAGQATVEAEFGVLTAKAGLDAASPTP
jgi:hypothetical protein